MLRSIALATLGLAVCAEAQAECLRETTLPGSLRPRQTVERGFTVTRTGANFAVVTDSQNNRVKWRIVRPNGRKLDCAQKGPAAELSCNPEGRPPGYYRIFITNAMSRNVDYWISCNNPP